MTVVTPGGFTVFGIATGTPVSLGGLLGRGSALFGRVTHIALAALAGPALLEHSVGPLVPAAVEGVLNEGNAALVTVRTVVVGANSPMSPAATLILANAGVPVVPDILANAGGFIVSHVE